MLKKVGFILIGLILSLVQVALAEELTCDPGARAIYLNASRPSQSQPASVDPTGVHSASVTVVRPENIPAENPGASPRDVEAESDAEGAR